MIRSDEGSDAAAERLVEMMVARHGDSVFSTDGSSIDEQVAALLEGRRLAVGESCTGGLLSARLTDRPGASAYFAGGVVAYSNEAKTELLGVPARADRAARRGLRRGRGGARRRRARALRRRHRDRPDRHRGTRTAERRTSPSAACRFCVTAVFDGDKERVTRSLDLPGSRGDIRDRSTAVALHLLRRLLRRESAPL